MRGHRLTDAESCAILLDEIDNGLKFPDYLNEIIKSVMTKGDVMQRIDNKAYNFIMDYVDKHYDSVVSSREDVKAFKDGKRELSFEEMTNITASTIGSLMEEAVELYVTESNEGGDGLNIQTRRLTDAEARALMKGDYLMGEIFTVDELCQIIVSTPEPDVAYKVPCTRCLFKSICDKPNDFDAKAIDELSCGGTIKYCLEKYCGVYIE